MQYLTNNETKVLQDKPTAIVWIKKSSLNLFFVMAS